MMYSDEDKCKFVSTIGIRNIADYVLFKNEFNLVYFFPEISGKNKIVYLKPCYKEIKYLCDNLSKIKESFFIILSGNDINIPYEIEDEHFKSILYSDKVLGIFAQNLYIKHDDVYAHKFFPIPIGIDYHTLKSSKKMHEWGGYPNMNPVVQEKVLNRCILNTKPIDKCDPRYVYTNFQTTMDMPPMRRILNRRPLYDLIHKKSWIKFLPNSKRSNFWEEISDKVFVLCPPGNGMDTHRTWEVLMLGRIPIIKKLPINDVYDKLPVWIIDDWEDFSKLETEDFVIKHKEFCEKWNSYDFSRLTLEYWRNYIKDHVSRM